MPKLTFLVFCVSIICSTLTYAADINNTDCEKETKKLRETPTMVKADEARSRKDINGEIKYLKIAIQENNPWAKMMLGLTYHEGTNTPKNDACQCHSLRDKWQIYVPLTLSNRRLVPL